MAAHASITFTSSGSVNGRWLRQMAPIARLVITSSPIAWVSVADK
jgi:hypothetical protein